MPEVENVPQPGIAAATAVNTSALAPLTPPVAVDLGVQVSVPTEIVPAIIVGVPGH